MKSPTRIVILGGGFGGVYTALHLEKLLGPNSDASVTLVSHENFFLFTPMLHEVAASDLDITHIVSPLRALLPRTSLVIGDIEAIDLDARSVLVRHGFDAHAHELAYDHLVIAMGSVTNFYNLPGLEQRALTMKSLGDAIHLRNRVIAALEEAGSECQMTEEGLLTFVVAGGGFAGVETLAAINDFVRDGLKFYPHIDPRQVRMVLVHPGALILPELGDELGAYAQKKLAERGVDVLVGTRVVSVSDAGVTLDTGQTIPSQVVVWTAGTAPNPLLQRLPCALDRGRIAADTTLAVPGRPGVWALGDCAVVPNLRTGRPHPPTAQHALRQAKTAAQNIVASMRQQPLVPFDFQTVGQLAAIGRRTGVARLFGVNFSGFVAWWLWRTIYLSKLPRLEKKIRVAIDWTLDLVFAKDLVQFQAVRSPTISLSDSATAQHHAMPAPVPAEAAR
jgi:NADH dehydrogenase